MTDTASIFEAVFCLEGRIQEVTMATTGSKLGNVAATHKEKKQDSARVKSGIAKLNRSIAEDIKRSQSHALSLPKDWRNRVLK